MIYSRIGLKRNTPGSNWKKIGSNFKSVTASFYGYWLLKENNEVYFSSYIPSVTIYPELTATRINGKFRKISAGFGGNVWALDQDFNVFRRINVRTLTPSGTGWEQIDGLKLYDIAAGYDAVYGITPAGRILKFTGKFRVFHLDFYPSRLTTLKQRPFKVHNVQITLYER